MTADVLVDVRHTPGVFDRDDDLSGANHELVAFGRDEETGLKAIIAVHDTTLGPALGGTRFFPYRSEAAALTDALRLSRGMTFKAAAAGMPLGGGKAVIIGDPAKTKTAELLRAYGRFVDGLGGRYITAADIGTTSDDLDVVGEVSAHVVGRSQTTGGSGDSGYLTAYGVFRAMQAAAERLWGKDGLHGRTVGIEGAGKVGFHLVSLVRETGANIVVSDPYVPALERLNDEFGPVVAVNRIVDHDVDVYAPCALGATLTPQSVPSLKAKLVCGAANNQLLTEDVDRLMAARGVLWIPDFVANAGGLIQVGSELQGRTADEVHDDVRKIGSTVSDILDASDRDGVTPCESAKRIVESLLREAKKVLAHD
jgi:valine dehydrogenase (NAD+)